MNIIFVCLLGLMCVMQSVADTREPNNTVFLTILARNKAHMLSEYLSCIDKLEYDKQLITVYINTNNNSDSTKEILENWAKNHEGDYKQIILENHEVQALTNNDVTLPHDWTVQRLKILCNIREKSLQVARDCKCDYYFIVDCDNFIVPLTLKHLILQNKPLIAPMLAAIPEASDPYSNFFCDVSESGYWKNHELYWNILARKVIGTIKVPLIHCTYLIDMSYIDKLTYVDGTNDYDFVIFARSARNNDVGQYICNDERFGILWHALTDLTLEEEGQRAKVYFQSLKN